MRRTLLWITPLAALLCASAWGQVMIEYGGMGATSATGISRAAGSVAGAADTLGKRLGDAIANPGRPGAAAATSPDNPRLSSRRAMQHPAGQHGAMLHVASVPQGAMLFVDHRAIARTPVDVRLPVGKHALELKLPSYLEWTQEVSAADGDKLSFEPKLQENQQAQQENKPAQSDGRIINLSF